MLEIKGKVAPVISIKIKYKKNFNQLLKELEKKLNHSFFKNGFIFLENPEILTHEEKENLKKVIKDYTEIYFEKPKKPAELLILNRSVRAGQKIEHEGDILVLGDVNPDAEVVAGGNIIVMGKLKGVARAGVFGNKNAIIVALKMEPQLIQIGSKKAFLREEEKISPEYPEVAKIEDGEIILETIKG